MDLYDRLRARLPDYFRLEQEGAHYSVTPRAAPRCDFCSGPDVTHDIRSPDFRMPGPGPEMWSRGDWAACRACATLIEANLWEQLIARVRETTPAYAPTPSVEYLRAVYVLLRAHMTGLFLLPEGPSDV